MFVPIVPVGLGGARQMEALTEKLRRLEQDLETALTLLRVLSERMRHALGSEVIGPELCRFLTAFDPSEQQELIGRLDALIEGGREPEAVRLIRDLTGVTWDQALAIGSAWRQYPQEDKVKWVRSVQLHRAIRPPGGRERCP